MAFAGGGLKVLVMLCCLLPVAACGEVRQTQSAKELNLDAPMELAFWQSVVVSQEPAAYEAYLETYPEGHFSALARVHLQSLSRRRQPTPSATSRSRLGAAGADRAPGPTTMVEVQPGLRLWPIDEIHAATKPSNVREGPGTAYGIVGKLAEGEEVIVIGQVDGLEWYQVALARGTIGFVYGPLLGLDANRGGPGAEAIALSAESVARQREERLAWESLRDSDDWLDYQRYIWIYGDHALYAPEARWRRDHLKTGEEPRLATAAAGLAESGQEGSAGGPAAQPAGLAAANPVPPTKRYDGRWTGVALTRFGTQCKTSYDINMIVAGRMIHGAMLRSAELFSLNGKIDEGGNIKDLEAASGRRVDFLVLSATDEEISGRWSMSAKHNYGGSPCTGSFNLYPV